MANSEFKQAKEVSNFIQSKKLFNPFKIICEFLEILWFIPPKPWYNDYIIQNILLVFHKIAG